MEIVVLHNVIAHEYGNDGSAGVWIKIMAPEGPIGHDGKFLGPNSTDGNGRKDATHIVKSLWRNIGK
jgi:hypothetical protein